MKYEQLFRLAAIMVLVLAVGSLGCGGTGDAEASAGSSEQDSASSATDGGDDAGQGTGEKSDAKQEEGDKKDKKRKKGDKDDDDKKKEEAVPVEVTDLGTGDIEAVLRFSTNLEAESEVQVFSQAARRITELLVEEGDQVRKDRVLLRLEDDEQLNNVALVKSELNKARREYDRQKRLYAENLISEQAFNDATYQIEQLEIRLANAERELSYTELRAPISGTITRRYVNLGDQLTVGQHVFDLVDFDSIVARVYVPEKHLRELRTGQPARVTAPSLGGERCAGRVRRISPIVDPKTGTVMVTVGLGGQGGLRPGLYVDVDLVTATHTDALLVPKRAVVYDSDRMFVFRLKNDDEKDQRRAERVAIEPALIDKEYVEPRDGLAPGDQIIIAGQTGLKDGVLVSLPGDEEKNKEEEEAETEGEGAKAEERASL